MRLACLCAEARPSPITVRQTPGCEICARNTNVLRASRGTCARVCSPGNGSTHPLCAQVQTPQPRLGTDGLYAEQICPRPCGIEDGEVPETGEPHCGNPCVRAW